MTADQTTLINDGRFDYVEGSAFPDGSGGWLFGLEATRYFDPVSPPDDAALLAGLSFLPGSDAALDQTYFDFANRLAPLVAFLKSIGVWALPHPWLNVFVPAAQAASFLQQTLAGTTVADVGEGPILIYPFKRSQVTADFLPLPAGNVSFLFSVLRNSLPTIPNHTTAQLQQNRDIYDAVRAVGGTMYAIGSIPFSGTDWQDHFDAAWCDFVAAKNTYDPQRVLTPGQEILLVCTRRIAGLGSHSARECPQMSDACAMPFARRFNERPARPRSDRDRRRQHAGGRASHPARTRRYGPRVDRDAPPQ